MRYNLASLVLATAVIAVPAARAELIYRETFGHTNSTVDQPLKDFGWGVHVGTGASYVTEQLLLVSRGTGKPHSAAAVANVNAGDPLVPRELGYHWGNPSGTGTDAEKFRAIIWTPEYAFNPAGYVPGSLVFSWYQGNANVGDVMRVAIRIAGQWYVSEAGFSNVAAVTSGGNFFRGDDQGNGDPTGHGAELKSFTFTTAASAWRRLTFDGTFNSVTKTGTSGAVLSMAGTTLAADLPAGTIDAFGLFTNNPATGNRRFDTFTIAGEPVPEPAILGLLAGALLGLAAVNRGRRRV